MLRDVLFLFLKATAGPLMTNTVAYGKCSVTIMEHAAHVRRDAVVCVRARAREFPVFPRTRPRGGVEGAAVVAPLTGGCFRSAVKISSIKDKALLNIIELYRLPLSAVRSNSRARYPRAHW